MKIKTLALTIIKIILVIIIPIFLFKSFQYLSKAAPKKANIVVDTNKIVGFIRPNWKALAQGGEEKGVEMFVNVISPLTDLAPNYIRIDHIYDFYDVVSKDNGVISFNWTKLDQTVCHIFQTGAKPMLALSYMPPSISNDGSLISPPSNWYDWSLVVQKTIEHYSGKNSSLCGQVNDRLTDIYYEVWNEPDLESFGKWSLYGGSKDYKLLYYYSSLGAGNAKNVNHFLLGGPATTAPYKNWFQVFLNYVAENKLRLDFISFHHYSKQADDFYDDIIKINDWLADDKYTKFRFVPKIISEWGFDSSANLVADTNIGAAHTVASIRNLIEQQVEAAFAFEVKDGPTPSWGILSYNGQPKPRYFALKLLNTLSKTQLKVDGEGTYVKTIASSSYNKVNIVLVNYDINNRNTELVPLTFINLTPGNYKITETNLEKKTLTSSIIINASDPTLKKFIIMPPNSVISIELIKE